MIISPGADMMILMSRQEKEELVKHLGSLSIDAEGDLTFAKLDDVLTDEVKEKVIASPIFKFFRYLKRGSADV